MKRLNYRTIVLLVISVAVVALPLTILVAPAVYFSWKVKSSLEDTPGVKNIERYFAYEGKAFAIVRLESGDLVWLDNLRTDSFSPDSTVRVASYNDYAAICRLNGEPSSTAFDTKDLIAAIARSKGEQLELRTLADVFEQIEEVKKYVYSLPNAEAGGQRLSLSSIGDGAATICYKKPVNMDKTLEDLRKPAR